MVQVSDSAKKRLLHLLSESKENCYVRVGVKSGGCSGLSYELEFDNEYDCLVTGYEESLKKIQEIGEIDVNEHKMYIKFGCYEVEPENQELAA